MKLRLGLALLIPPLLALLSSSVIAQTAEEKKDSDLPSFYQVNEHLYRGAQPTLEGIRKLAALGVKTILSLRGDGKISIEEAKAVLDAGMQYKSVPMPGYGRPKDEQVETALEIINEQSNWPIFIHCKHGEDRTGLIIACYRMSNEDITDEEAMKEAKQFGMSRFQFGMKDFINDFQKRKTRHKSHGVPKSVGLRMGAATVRSFSRFANSSLGSITLALKSNSTSGWLFYITA